MALASSPVLEKSQVTVVGGGIAGLYAAYLLARQNYTVDLYEVHPTHLGGKIATRWYPDEEEPDREFWAEFGPMRFELGLQVRLQALCDHLGLTFKPFSKTAAPLVPNDYEMTDVERAFDSAADLHLWAVLKMFYGRKREVCQDLKTIEEEIGASPRLKNSTDGELQAREIGRLQLQYLQCYVDQQVFCVADPPTNGVKARPADERDQRLDELRRKQRLGGDNTNTKLPLLREIGLWHGLSEVITPGAVARIRDSGTFYHCIASNPSAVEWGIFWLRQASVLGTLYTLDSATAKDGIFSIVSALREKIDGELDEAGAPRVVIRQGCEVQQVEPGKRPNEVVLRIRQLTNGEEEPHSFNLRTDHVILALPRMPLRRLWEHFPPDVRARIDGVGPLRLLKAFVVTKKPWWPAKFGAQSYAWRVPTRELHFYRKKGTEIGMIMLYTDEPAIRYWDVLIPKAHKNSVLWREFKGGVDTALIEVERDRFGLLEMLIRRLLVLPHPGLPGSLDHFKRQFRADLLKHNPDVHSALIELDNTGALLGESERIVELLDGDPPEEAFNDIDLALRNTLGSLVPPEREGWLKAFTTALEFRQAGVIGTDVVDAAAKDVLAYGIRDWSAEPYGGAAHFWLPGFSWAHASATGSPVDDPLLAFPLRERSGRVANIHICGEAYSGDQGFIEGALQTAEDVVRNITGAETPTLRPDSRQQSRREEAGHKRNSVHKAEWDRRQAVDGLERQMASVDDGSRATESDFPGWRAIVPTLGDLAISSGERNDGRIGAVSG